MVERTASLGVVTGAATATANCSQGADDHHADATTDEMFWAAAGVVCWHVLTAFRGGTSQRAPSL
jgi:hypothetical protein